MSNTVFTGPDEVDYRLDHLAPFTFEFELRRKTGTVIVPIYVTFSDHTYSRDPHPDEGDAWLLPPVPGKPDRRFCPDRWEFSHGLPALVRDFLSAGNKTCRVLDRHRSYLRIERDGLAKFVGWYLFFDLERRTRPHTIRMTFRSAHHRDALPGNDLGKSPVQIWKLIDQLVP